MSNKSEKPKKSPTELIAMLQSEKGITFNIMSEADAADYLSSHNNYLRTASYRYNYEKHRTGENEGKYIQLDFAYLVELSKLDMYLRGYLLPMCIDIEHAVKRKLITDIESNTQEDGYSIVDIFLQDNPAIVNSIAQKADSVFTGDLIAKYFGLCYVFDAAGNMRTDILSVDCPVWVLVELLAFNDLIRFAKFYTEQYPNRLTINFKQLNVVRSLRNACAHNNCLLLSLRPGKTKPLSDVTQAVASISTIQKEERKNKLSCRPLFETVCMLIEYTELVSDQVRIHRMKELQSFTNGRLVKNAVYFANNQIVSTAFEFLRKAVDNFAN